MNIRNTRYNCLGLCCGCLSVAGLSEMSLAGWVHDNVRTYLSMVRDSMIDTS